MVQLPITGWFPEATPRVYAQALLMSTASMALLTLLAGLYPSFLATRVQPAQALHYD